MEKSKIKRSKIEKDPDKDFKKKSPDEWLAAQTLKSLEEDRLNKVFRFIVAKDLDKLTKIKRDLKSSMNASQQISEEDLKERANRITEGDLKRLFEDMKVYVKASEIKDMIWEIDEDMDKSVTYQEFVNMYKRCVNDNEYLEPRKLFNLVQFLMFDKEFEGKIIEEQTLELLIIRYGRDGLNEQLDAIFGNDKAKGDEEKSITYKEYIDKVNQMALKYHKSLREKRLEDVSKSKI